MNFSPFSSIKFKKDKKNKKNVRKGSKSKKTTIVESDEEPTKRKNVFSSEEEGNDVEFRKCNREKHAESDLQKEDDDEDMLFSRDAHQVKNNNLQFLSY